MLPLNLSLDRLLANYANNPTQENTDRLRSALPKAVFYYSVNSSIQDPDLKDALSVVSMNEEFPVDAVYLYTSKAAAEKAGMLPGHDAFAQMSFTQLLAALAKLNPSTAVVFNQHSTTAVFPSRAFAAAFNPEGMVIEQKFDEDTILTFRRLGGTIKPKYRNQLEKVLRMNPNVDKAWLCQSVINGRDNLVLALEGKEISAQQAAYLGTSAAKILKVKKSVTIFLSESEPKVIEDISGAFDPIYVNPLSKSSSRLSA